MSKRLNTSKVITELNFASPIHIRLNERHICLSSIHIRIDEPGIY